MEHKNQDSARQAQRRESRSTLAYPSRTIVHAKLEMTEPGDHDEQEADDVANIIVGGGKIARKISGGGGSSGIAVSQQMESQLSQLQGGGRQMPEGLRNMMESGFGRDFSQVRLHTDSEAASMSSSIHAKAFTLGNDIYFNRGQFSPETSEGQRLVAHELTHVAQGTGKVGREPNTNNTENEPATTETKTEDNNDSIPSPNLNRKERAEFLYPDNLTYQKGAIKGSRVFFSRRKAKALTKIVEVPIWTEDNNGKRISGFLSLNVHHKLTAMVKQIFTEVFNESKEDNFIILIKKIPPHPKKGEEFVEKTQSAGWDYRYESKDYQPGDSRLGSYSEHTGGVAIDINTSFNPYKPINKYDDPIKYKKYQKYIIKSDSILVKTFKKYGWRWGGEWNQEDKDFMHFEWFSKTYPKS